MTHRLRIARAAAGAVLVLAFAARAAAETAPTVRIRGEIAAIEAGRLSVMDRDGRALTVTLAANLRVTELRKAELSEIAAGKYIGVTAFPAKDGALRAVAIHIFPDAAKGTAEGHRPWDLAPETTMTNATVDGVVSAGSGSTITVKYKDGALRAVAIHIFPDAARGTGEGHRPWDLAPETTMTNATVDGVVAAGNGSTIKVRYKDGEKTVIVTPETAIVAMGPGKPEMLKPGAKILIFGATRAADGSLSAQSVVVGRDGLAPPM